MADSSRLSSMAYSGDPGSCRRSRRRLCDSTKIQRASPRDRKACATKASRIWKKSGQLHDPRSATAPRGGGASHMAGNVITDSGPRNIGHWLSHMLALALLRMLECACHNWGVVSKLGMRLAKSSFTEILTARPSRVGRWSEKFSDAWSLTSAAHHGSARSRARHPAPDWHIPLRALVADVTPESNTRSRQVRRIERRSSTLHPKYHVSC